MIQDLISFNFPIWVYAIVLVVWTIEYVFVAMVYTTVCKAEKYKNWYLFWIPVINIYMFKRFGKSARLAKHESIYPYENILWLFSCLVLIFPNLWVFGLIGLLSLIANAIDELLDKYGTGSILIYLGMVIPFVGLIPMYELYNRARFNIDNGFEVNIEKFDKYDNIL